ncbi:uncharacterized protein LOC134267471 [Saccostrea cucullata]|uniref:uncharacterized protein LOC134267471 n=1 Tax=Saccostrea cuccullata TaxID=36930 RepID=UPI002ED1C2E0
MPGEQLTCILQIAHSKFGGISLQRETLSRAFSAIGLTKILRFTKKEFSRELRDTVTFPELKKFIVSKRDEKSTELEIQDRIELACWKLSKGDFPRRPFSESDIFKLWQIFNRFADEDSYPPVISQQDSCWVFEKFATGANKDREILFEKRDLTFHNFLSCLENIGDPETVSKATKDIYEWLVREVIKGGWMYVRNTRRFNWSSWTRKWVTLTPGKIQFSGKKITVHSVDKIKERFYISDQTVFEKCETQIKGMKHVIHVSQAPIFECYFAATDDNEVEQWLAAMKESLKYCTEDISPVQLILKKTSSKDSEDSLNQRAKTREKSFVRSKTRKIERKKEKQKGKMNPNVKKSLYRLQSKDNENNTKDKIKAVFLELDHDGNGYLDEKEFSVALKQFGLEMTEAEVRQIFKAIDVDDNGKIVFQEFYDYFIEKILSEESSALAKAFTEADDNKNGTVNFREFSEFVRNRHNSVGLDKVLSVFDKLCSDDGKDELSFQDFQCMSFLDELGIFQDTSDNFEAQLKSHFNSSDSNALQEKIRKRWEKFASFRRKGDDGGLVMTGASGIVEDIVPGEYNLNDLANFDDLPQLLPKMTIIQRVAWESSGIPNTSGSLLFPSDFTGNIEVEIATTELLGYYGCTFADGRKEKVSLPYRHAIQDFTYKDGYLSDYVEKKNGGAGLERHGFLHVDCPLDDDSGYFILGKLTEDELRVTAFKIPKRHTLFVPGNCIHSNDYLKGTWRTMLSDETNIDHVHLLRKSDNDEKPTWEPFTFTFEA